MWTKGIRFSLEEVLGEGSQGCVFRALRLDLATGLKQAVAVKILHSKTAVELWRNEFESLSRVRSPYCVQVLSFERVRGRPALVLELVNGVSLADLGRTCLLSPGTIEEIVAQIQAGLSDLREHGTFHGDLSPANVMVDESGRVRLLDFGLANGGQRLTPEFAAPERLTGSPPDFAADLFSLGRIEMFLRGVKLCSSQPSPYLFSVAGLRHTRDIEPQPHRQAELGRMVRQLRERRHLNSRTRTVGPLPGARIPKAWLLALVTSSFILAASGASQAIQRGGGFLSLRTKNWHYLMLDGTPLGYAPLTVQLKPGRIHRLDWVSARGRGRRDIRVERDQHLILTDRDFSH